MDKTLTVKVFDLMCKEGQLPAVLDKLVPLSFIGQSAVGFYREKLKLLKHLDVANEQRQATLADGQDAGKMLLDIEARIGELFSKLPRKKSWADDSIKSIPAQTADIGIKERDAYRAQEVFEHPEAVAEVIKEAEENEEIPTKTAVLNKVRADALEEKMEAMRANRTEEAESPRVGSIINTCVLHVSELNMVLGDLLDNIDDLSLEDQKELAKLGSLLKRTLQIIKERGTEQCRALLLQ